MTILATANGYSISVSDALRQSIVHDEDFLKNKVDALLLRSYAAKNNIANSDAELQLATDELRYQKGLETVDKVKQWMKTNHQSLLNLQNAIDHMLLRNKIRNAIPDNEIAAYYAEHQLEFHSVELYSCRLDTEDKARELLSQITEEGANFHVIAMEHSLDTETKHLGGYAGKLRRSQMTGAVEAAVLKAKPGQVIGPIKTDKGYNLFKVAAVHKPTLEEEKDNIRMTLFENLLAKLRSESSISYPVLEEAEAQAV